MCWDGYKQTACCFDSPIPLSMLLWLFKVTRSRATGKGFHRDASRVRSLMLPAWSSAKTPQPYTQQVDGLCWLWIGLHVSRGKFFFSCACLRMQSSTAASVKLWYTTSHLKQVCVFVRFLSSWPCRGGIHGTLCKESCNVDAKIWMAWQKGRQTPTNGMVNLQKARSKR